MKSYKFLILLIAVVSVVMSGCAYTKTQMPLDKNYDMTELGTKIGRASNYSLLFLFAWGDAGSNAAAKDGGIKVIKHADRELFSVLFGLYTRNTTVVYGD